MGNNSSHRRTRAPKQAGKKRPPDPDKAPGKQQFFSHFRQKPATKIVLLFSAERQQLAEAAAGPAPWPGRPSEEPGGSLAAPPRMRGAGDGTEWRAGAPGEPGPRRAAGGGRAPRPQDLDRDRDRDRDQNRDQGRGRGRAGPPVPVRAW